MKKKKAKMGRPPMKPSERLGKIIRIRLKQADLDRLEREARQSGKTLSAVIRAKLERGERK